MTKRSKIIAVSGYFLWLHAGHIEYFKRAQKLGRVVVILNNDTQQVLKYGKVIVPLKERLEIIKAIRYIDRVIVSQDLDRTVCKSLLTIRPHIFANGGDRDYKNIPETEICERYGIQMVFGLGAKINSSSELLKKL